PPGLRDADGHAAVLERSGRIVALVLEQQMRGAGPAVERVPVQQGGVAFRVRDDVSGRRQDDLAEPPDARGRRAGMLAPPLGEPLDQLGPAELGRAMTDLEQPAACDAARMRVELGGLVAAAEA